MPNITTNTSSATSLSYPIEQHVALQTSFGIIAFLSFTANGLLVLFFIKNRDLLKTSYSIFILNLAITDMITGIGLVITPSFIVGNGNFPFPSGFVGELFCRIVATYFMVFTCGIVSVYTIAVLAIERWVAVARPAKYKTIFKKNRAIVILMLVWLCSIVLNSPSLFKKTLGPNNRCVWIVVMNEAMRGAVAVIIINIEYFIPFLVISVLFVNLRMRVRKSPALFKTNHGKAGIRLLRMCTVSAVALGVCWIPNQISFMLFNFNLTEHDSPFYHFTIVLCMSNSCLNPFIYCATNKAYRERFVTFICPCTKNYVGTLDVEGHIETPRTDNADTSTHQQQQSEMKA